MKLPNSLQEIADIIGRDKALILAGRLPRTCSPSRKSGQVLLYVPRIIPPDHALARCIGVDAAQKLAEHFGGETVPVPKCKEILSRYRDASMARLLADGYPATAVAEMFGIGGQYAKTVATREKLAKGFPERRPATQPR